MQLLKTVRERKKNCWKLFYMQVLQQQDFLINEQKVNEPHSQYSLANITKQHITLPDAHPHSVHDRPAH